VRLLETEIRQCSSPVGSAEQRLGKLLLRAIKLRGAVGTPQWPHAEVGGRLMRATLRVQGAPADAVVAYHQLLPLRSLIFTAVSTILETTAPFRRLHLVLLGPQPAPLAGPSGTPSSRGSPCLPGAPESLRVTVIGLCFQLTGLGARTLASASRAVGAELEQEARRWGLKGFAFSYVEMGGQKGVAPMLEMLRQRRGEQGQRLGADLGEAGRGPGWREGCAFAGGPQCGKGEGGLPGEGLCVTSLLRLFNLSEEHADAHCPNPQAFLFEVSGWSSRLSWEWACRQCLHIGSATKVAYVGITHAVAICFCEGPQHMLSCLLMPSMPGHQFSDPEFVC